MTTTECTVGQFKAHFSKMLSLVEKGESVVVTYGKKKRPVAVLSPPLTKPKRKLGHLAGKLKVTIGSDWEMTEEEFLGQ